MLTKDGTCTSSQKLKLLARSMAVQNIILEIYLVVENEEHCVRNVVRPLDLWQDGYCQLIGLHGRAEREGPPYFQFLRNKEEVRDLPTICSQMAWYCEWI